MISGATIVTPGRAATGRDELIARGPVAARIRNMQATLGASARGVRTSLVMLPRSVHGQGERHGFILQLPARPLPAGEFQGMLVPLLSTDMPASSTITQEPLGWKPIHPGLIEDIEQGHYFS